MQWRKRMRGMGPALAVPTAAAFLLGISALRERTANRAGVMPVADRRAMGEMQFAQLDGGVWKLAGHRGEVVALNMWATWCGPCQQETPGLVRTVRELGPSGFTALGVSLDDSKGERRESKVRAFVKRFGVGYPIAFPDPMSQMAAGMRAIPTTLLLDREGRVAKTYVGAVREGVLREDVEALLREP